MLGGILLFGIILYFFVTDPFSFLFFALLIGVLIYVLVYMGFVTARTAPNELDVTYRPTPVPSASTANGPAPPESRTPLEEVFYVANNIFTYDQSTAVCKAYGGDLATYAQVEDAYRRGAEWCGYGWTAGGMALFPTQEETWRKLQLEVDPKKRIACGRPGINGGYFDPSLKFGVNCYGIRPEKKPGQITGDQSLAASVARIKGMLGKYTVNPFNQKDWSEYSGAGKSIVEAEANIRGLGSDIRSGSKEIEASLGSVGSEVVTTTGSVLEGLYNAARDGTTAVIQNVGSAGQSFFEGIRGTK